MPRVYSVDTDGRMSYWPNEKAAVTIGREQSHLGDTTIRRHETPKADKAAILDALNYEGWAESRRGEIVFKMRNGKVVDEF